MPVKRHKDRTGLISKTSLLASHVYDRRASGAGGKPRREYFMLYLWSTPEQLRTGANLEEGGGAVGCHCPTPVRISFDADGAESEAPRLLLGELHFAAGEWSDMVVSHELSHALLEADRSGVGASRLGGLDDAPFEHEEEWCYRFGRWFSTVYRCLWDRDPTLSPPGESGR